MRTNRRGSRGRRNRPSRNRSIGFRAVDGESFTIGGEHRYVLMASGDGSHVKNELGLSTKECLDFLFEVKANSYKRRVVGFGVNYDVNMILRDLTPGQLERLWHSTRLRLFLGETEYRLEWIPGKKFSATRDGTTVQVNETFGFFQTSFVKALEAWNIHDNGGHIARMKAERADFALKDLPEVLAYCLAECELLEGLMDKLEESLLGADLMPSTWIGAGSVAARMLRREGVKEWRVPDNEFPSGVTEAIRHAYFGGRTEVFLQGVLRDCTNYDLCSAYPSEALRLPALVGGRWFRTRLYDPSQPFALWKVRWEVSGSRHVMPFPFRTKGEIWYPENGAGWYHGKEVKAAMLLHPGCITVEEGWIFFPATDHKPFDFIREAYAKRRELKEKKHASEKALKLGLNALYGKLAQGYGYRGTTPPFQSYYWAGLITAGTRARLLDLSSLMPAHVVSMATDGIVFSGDPDLAESKELGGLEKTVYPEIFIAQPGIYKARTNDGEIVRRSRGFFSQEIDYDDLEEGWLEEGPYYVQRRESTRFVGLGAALMRTDLEAWRSWVTSERVLRLHTSRKFYDERVFKSRVMRLFPPRVLEGTESEIYKPKGRGLDIALEPEDFVVGFEQPLDNF